MVKIKLIVNYFVYYRFTCCRDRFPKREILAEIFILEIRCRGRRRDTIQTDIVFFL